MAFQTGTASSVANLFSTLSTFAQANGWTQDHTASDRLFLSKAGTDDTVYVAFRWSTATPQNVAVYQGNAFGGTGFVPGDSAHQDSGNGFTTATPSNADLDDERYVLLDDDTNTYWFFEDDDYIHVVVKRTTTSPEIFVHFGFGVLDKFNDWTGGAYVYGWRFDPTGGSSTTAVRTPTTMLLDGLASGTGMANYSATMHVEGLDGQPAGGKFGVVWGSTASAGNDRQSTPVARETLFGGFRGGAIAYPFGFWSANSTKGLVPMYPIHVWHREFSPDIIRPLGRMPDVRGVNVEFYSGGDEITVGSDTWVLFPSYRKQSTAGTENQGIAYRKVTT